MFAQATSLEPFADDFNRDALGSAYKLACGSAFGLTNGAHLVNGGHGQSHLLALRSGEPLALPDVADYAAGYSFCASVDLFVPIAGPTAVPTFGLFFNEQSGPKGSERRIIRFRGHSDTVCTLQFIGGDGIRESAPMEPVAANAWYTLRVSSKRSGVYSYAFLPRGSRKPLVSGAFIEKDSDQLAGGAFGIYAENAPAGAYLFDNLSLTVTKTDPGALRELLLFAGTQDVANVWGQLHFGVTPLQRVATCADPGFTPVYSLPQKDGSCLVYGSVFYEDPDIKSKKLSDSGTDMARVRSTFDIVRAVTRDGVRFEGTETLYTSPPANWSFHCAIAHRPDTGGFLLLRLLADNTGFGYRAFASPDGRAWSYPSTKPLFYDGDAMSLFWHPGLSRYVCVSKTLQPVLKRIRDHGGVTPSLGNSALRDRRVLALRTSPDGFAWTPSASMEDVWNREGRKKSLPAEYMTVPDAEDPPDLEFYSGNAFWYVDRPFMMVLNYAASPLIKSHGPQLDTEWWSGFGELCWQRPGRGVNATGAEITRNTHNPIALNGRLLFHYGSHVLGMPRSRITFVGARANAEFSTPPFAMPASDLLLNAAIPSGERAFAAQQAYVRVAVLDEAGAVVPGFEAERCLLKSGDDIDLPLQWDERSARELAGRKVSLRFFLRSADIYAVSASAAAGAIARP
jgi:hypothetical protein